MRTLIQGGTLVTASDTCRGDLLIDGETIAAVGVHFDPAWCQPDRVLDASERLVLPGGIDCHTHLDMPFGGTVSADDFLTGTRAAALGGTTSIIDFATPAPAWTLAQTLAVWQEKARGKACIDYGLHMIVREQRAELGADMAAVVAQGVTSFKVFLAYPGALMLDDGAILRVLQLARDLGALVSVHGENGAAISALTQAALAQGHTAPRYHALTRPACLEAEATARALVLAHLAAAPLYVVHLSAQEALTAVERARASGQVVYAETCPQYLLLTQECYDEPGFGGAKYVMSPPLRSAADQAALWQGCRGRQIDVVATDHCPFTLAQKELGRADFTKIPNGAPGIETRLTLLFAYGVHTGKLSLSRWVELTSTRAAQIFGMWPQKGSLAPGADADVVIFDPRAEQCISAATHHMRVDYSLYEGRPLRGAVETVLSRGRVIVDKGRFVGEAGHGRFVRRAAHSARGMDDVAVAG